MYNTATITVTLPIELLADLVKISQETQKPINDLAYYALKSLINNQGEPDYKEIEKRALNFNHLFKGTKI